MANNIPIAQDDARIPIGAAPPPPAPQGLGVAARVEGAAELLAPPPAKRPRAPRGPVATGSTSSNNAAPQLLELAAAFPMHTVQRRTPNQFLPDSQMLFHVLSVCDRLMVSTERFTRSCPSWIPIVSQLYISLLWNTHIIRVIVNSGYGQHLSSTLDLLIHQLRIDECVIPGPLVPFFQAISAISGPYDWMGDIIPRFPTVRQLWNPALPGPRETHSRFIPLPFIMLDQLIRFGTSVLGQGQETNYPDFLWYHDIFGATGPDLGYSYHLGPQLCGSLNTSRNLHDTARIHWQSYVNGTARFSIAADRPAPTRLEQLFGLEDQNGNPQTQWFPMVSLAMQKYCQYFNGSLSLKFIPTAGIGSVALRGIPEIHPAVSSWLFPPDANFTGFLSSRYAPLRPIPPQLSLSFIHADPHLERSDEQFAVISHTNIDWSVIPSANPLQIGLGNVSFQSGDYWQLHHHRENEQVTFALQFTQLIASRYHQQNANRAE